MLRYRLSICSQVVPYNEAIKVEYAKGSLLYNIPLLLLHNSLANGSENIRDIYPLLVVDGRCNIGYLNAIILLQKLEERLVEQRVLITANHIVAFICRLPLQSYWIEHYRGEVRSRLSLLIPLQEAECHIECIGTTLLYRQTSRTIERSQYFGQCGKVLIRAQSILIQLLE